MAVKTRVFFDTNILVYQFDRTASAKQKIAEQLIEQQLRSERAVISSQVVQEFMSVSLSKFKTPLPPGELDSVMKTLLKPICQHYPSFEFYERTLQIYQSNSLSFYDALIIQAALDLGCSTIYSEDLQDGQTFGSLTIKNPFA